MEHADRKWGTLIIVGNHSLTNLANDGSISFGYDFRGPEVHETYFRVKYLGSGWIQ